jgi:hypothetical protein
MPAITEPSSLLPRPLIETLSRLPCGPYIRAVVPDCTHAWFQATYGVSDTIITTQSAPPLVDSATCGL